MITLRLNEIGMKMNTMTVLVDGKVERPKHPQYAPMFEFEYSETEKGDTMNFLREVEDFAEKLGLYEEFEAAYTAARETRGVKRSVYVALVVLGNKLVFVKK